jgi:malonyl CoA-acyl carrier protein transacylase
MEEPKRRGRPPSEKGPKKPRSIKLEHELDQQLTRAVYWLTAPDKLPDCSINWILEEGAKLLLAKLEKQYNGGKPFPPIPGE